jgi:hypothetical protein
MRRAPDVHRRKPGRPGEVPPMSVGPRRLDALWTPPSVTQQKLTESSRVCVLPDRRVSYGIYFFEAPSSWKRPRDQTQESYGISGFAGDCARFVHSVHVPQVAESFGRYLPTRFAGLKCSCLAASAGRQTGNRVSRYGPRANGANHILVEYGTSTTS